MISAPLNDLFFLDEYIESSIFEEVERPIKLFQDNPNIPVYSKENPKLMVIFRICLLKRANDPVVWKQKLFDVKTTSTFILDQASSNTKLPYGFNADHSMGAAKKREYVRF